MKIRFIKNPVGLFNLAYDPGEEVDLPDQLAREIIEDGYAVQIPLGDSVETAESKPTGVEKAIKKRR